VSRRGAGATPGRVEAVYRRAVRHHQAGALARAERDYRRVLREAPAHLGALCDLAMLEARGGSPAAGIERLRRAIGRGLRAPELYNNLGVLLRAAGRLEEAIGAYREAIALAPAHRNAHFNLANALHASGRPAEAVARYREVVRIAPGDAQGWAGLGSALLDAGRAGEAKSALEHSLRLAPEVPYTLNELGLVHTDLGEFEEAARCFRRVLERDPADARACLNLVRTRRIEDPEDPDVARIERAARAAGADPEARADLHFALGKVYDDCGRYEEAFAHFREGNELGRAGRAFDAAARMAEIERIAAVFDRALLARLAGLGSDSELPVLIVGMPRSGTSLVEQIVASHPQAAGAGELPDLAAAARELPAALGSERGYPECAAELDGERAAPIAEAYLARLAEAGGAKALRVTDKMPSNWTVLGLVALLFPRARVIHCRRDPRDTALSIYFRRFTQGHGYSFDLADIAAEMRAYRRLMAHWQAVLPLAMLEVDYEALVADQEAQIRRIIEFLGLPWDGRCLRFHETRRAVHTASAWQVRQPIYARSVGRWRHYERHLGALLEALDPGR